ncbi:MAG: hypothetical protein JW714_01915 [Candidatus Omnitrophica bacterium]|nr:hypothetical protein [Candidatus Omnitrophota bacterium]
MRYSYKPSFLKTLKKLTPTAKSSVKEAIKELVIFFETGTRPGGLGLKKLRGQFWEIRAGLKIRIIFCLSDDIVEFIIVGTHDQIKQYLKQV